MDVPVAEWPAVVAIFEDIDTDGDGKLQKTELRQRLADDAGLLGMLADANKSVDNIFATLDINGDGMISFDEFVELLEWEQPEPVNPDPPVHRPAFKHLRIKDFVAQAVTYSTNDTREKKILEYIEDFNMQFTQLYPERRPLLLCPRNECGVRKFVCTTLRPTQLPYKELYDFRSCAGFVSDYINFELLADPLSHPDHAPSPHSVFTWQRGDALDMANGLCSLLLGVGYDAYVVSGYAPPAVCSGDESALPHGEDGVIPEGESIELMASLKATQARDKSAPRTRKNPYEFKAPPALESGYEQAQMAKEAREARVAAAKAGTVEPAELPPDTYHGMRVHYWVLLRVGKRQVSQPLFIDPVCGRIYPVANSPFLGVESVWNHTNYFVNMQGLDLSMSKMSWKLQNPSLFEFIFFEAPSGEFDLRLDAAEGDHVVDSEAPELVSSAQADDGTEGQVTDVLEVPPSWSRKIEITRDAFLQKALGGEKKRDFCRTRLEVFAEYHREDGCTSILTMYGDDACEDTLQRQSRYEHRVDKLFERVEYFEDAYFGARIHDKFLQGHREVTGQAAYGGQATGRVTGLKDVIESADSRRLLFYPSARLDGLQERFEQFGVKIYEKFRPGHGGKTGHLVFRSVCFDTEGKTVDELRELKDVPLVDMKIRKMTEKFERNPDVRVDENVYKKTYYWRESTIRFSYHHQPGRITRRVRDFCKETELRVDPLELEPITVEDYDEFKKMPKVLEEAMKECMASAKDAEHEARSILEARVRDEQEIKLEESVYETIRKRIAAGAGEDTGDDGKAQLIQERDYLKPYLPSQHASGDMSVQLQKDDAIHVKDECLKALKDRLIERANIIQSRLDAENAILARKQAAFQRTRDHATPEAEEEYEEFCAEAWFRIQILEQRLARHEDQALQKFAELDTKLRNDPRLACLHEFS